MKSKHFKYHFIIVFLITIIVLLLMVLSYKVDNLIEENLLLRQTLNEQNGVIWLNQASKFDMKE